MGFLKKIISYRSKIIRNGEKINLDSTKIVVGDILVLQPGDRVPADGRIVECNDFQVNEASLTSRFAEVIMRASTGMLLP